MGVFCDIWKKDFNFCKILGVGFFFLSISSTLHNKELCSGLAKNF